MEQGLEMEFLCDLQALSELIDPASEVTDPIWTSVRENIFVVAVRSAADDGFYQGMGYLIPSTNWIASTAHILQRSGSLSPRFYDVHTGAIIQTQCSVKKKVGATQSVDVTMHETELLSVGKFATRSAVMSESVVVLQAVFTEETMKAHAAKNSKFIVTEAAIIAVSEGTVLGVKDGIIRHTAFTTKGSSGAPVFARDGSALLGMSFYCEDGESYAESAGNITTDMGKAVPLLATKNTLKNSQAMQSSGKFNHYAFINITKSYADACTTIDADLKKDVVKAAAQYNEPHRLLELSGELVDRFVPAKGNKQLVLEMIDNVELRFITENYQSNGCKTIFEYPAGPNPVLRFDKQLGTVAKFAIQPNSNSGKGEYRNKTAQGIVYSQITVNKTTFGAYLIGGLPHITEADAVEIIRKAMRTSLANECNVDVIFPDAPAVAPIVTSAKGNRSKAFFEKYK